MNIRVFVNRVRRRIGRKHAAATVSHAQAMKWFEGRRDDYDTLIAAVAPYVKKDAVILDVGANIGFFTHRLSEKLALKGSACLFEPVPALAALCRKTFEASPLKATVFNFGLGDTDTEQDIFIATDGNLGWNTLVAGKASTDMTRTRIRLVRFDTSGIDVTPSFIKIDVEGSEYQVLRGMLGSFRKWQPLPVVLCEVAWGSTHPAWHEELEVFAQMRSIGYEICDLDGRPIDERGISGTVDVLFLPADRTASKPVHE